MRIPSPRQPEQAEFEDWIDLADGRIWMLCAQFSENGVEIPLCSLDQFPTFEACEELREDGRVWFRVDDLPAIVKMLTWWLEAYRECARKDAAGPHPRPNWGALAEAGHDDQCGSGPQTDGGG